MNLHISQKNSVTLIELEGRFDAYEAPQLEKALKKLGTKDAGEISSQVVIDLAKVHFIDSTGLATLIQGMKRCREHNGDVYLCSLQQPVRIIIELTRLDKVFALFETPEKALEHFANEHALSANSSF